MEPISFMIQMFNTNRNSFKTRLLYNPIIEIKGVKFNFVFQRKLQCQFKFRITWSNLHVVNGSNRFVTSKIGKSIIFYFYYMASDEI